MKPPNRSELPILLDQDARVRPHRGGSKVLEVLLQLSAKSDRQSGGLRQPTTVEFDRAEAQSPSLWYASADGIVLTAPLRRAAIRVRSSAMTSLG